MENIKLDPVGVTLIKNKDILENECTDFDEDCEEVENKTLCWMYQPECGICPYLKGKT